MFELIKNLYFKQGIFKDLIISHSDLVVLFSILSRDKSISYIIKEHLKYLFFIEPKKIFISLYFNIPKKNYLPKFGKVNKKKIKIDKVLKALAEVFNWSNKELTNYESLLNKVIDKKEIIKILGVE